MTVYRRFLIIALLLPTISFAAVGNQAKKPLIRGEWSQGGILFGQVEPETRIKFMGKAVPVTSKGQFVLGLSRDAAAEAELVTVSPNGQERKFHFSVNQRDYDIQRIEGVEQKHVTPPKSVLKRISREAAEVREARTLVDAREDFLEEFQWPLTGRITGVYGSQRVYNGIPRSPHYGIDIAAPTGAPVTAPASGIVSYAADDLYYSGGTLILDHGHGLSSTFIHLHRISVEVGQRIKAGQQIAEVGATGRATGPHLDWRMNWMGVRVDPGLLMKNKPMEPVDAR